MRGRRPGLLLIVLLVGGALLGSILNDVLAPTLPILRHTAGGGLSPATLTLPVLSLTFGFHVSLSIGTALGLALALLVYRRF